MMSDWIFGYDRYDPRQEGLREALCATGNGRFVTRAACPDSVADDIHYPGTYLAGGYNRLLTRIGERDVENEDLVNIPNWLPLSIRIDEDTWLDLDHVEITAFRQFLDLRQGLLHRLLCLRDARGRTTHWDEIRFASMADPHAAALIVRITPADWSGTLHIESGIDGSVRNTGVARYRDLADRHLQTLAREQPAKDTILLRSRFTQARREIAVAARTRVFRGRQAVDDVERHTRMGDDRIAQELSLSAKARRTITIEKLVSLYNSRDPATSEAATDARTHALRRPPAATTLREHRARWRSHWDICDLTFDAPPDDPDTLRILRLHIFHLLQTVSPHSADIDAGAPARGWHGEAYRGHVFWDELFIMPFFNLHMPDVAESLLRYRYRRLPEARATALAAGHRGAMYPWQSGSTGREETQKFHLNPHSGRWLPDNSHRQRHVNLAIAYNVLQYYWSTRDERFMYHFGAEMLLEMARFWVSAAVHDPADDRYHIRGVMGPDEFHTAYPGRDPSAEGGIDDNAYTNVMLAWTLARTLETIGSLPEVRRRQLFESLGIDQAELEQWRDVSQRLHVPFVNDRILAQFAGYEHLDEFDWEAARERWGDTQRLDRLLEAEGDSPNNYRISKQADVLMLFFLLSTEELAQTMRQLGYPFEGAMIPENVEYYAARTSHGSTLSWVAHAWVYARADRDRAWDLFCKALRSDVADIQGGTTPEGIHLGAMAGTVDIMNRCFTGIEPRPDALHVNPCLPTALPNLRTRIIYDGHVLEIAIDQRQIRIRSHASNVPPVRLVYRGRFHVLEAGESCRFRLTPGQAQQPGASGIH